jgi:biotin carboxylase
VVLLRGTVGGGHAAELKRVLIIATTTGYQIRSFGEAAERLGVRLVFASDRCDQLDDPWWDQAIPIRFFDEPGSLQTIIDTLVANPPDGVVAVGDRPVPLAARVNEVFGLPGHPVGAAVASRNKFESRRSLQAAGLAVPNFRLVSLDGDAGNLALTFEYPCVVKPLAMSGSRGVIRVDNSCDFVHAFERLRALMDQPDVRIERDSTQGMLLVESFIPGREYAIEGLLTDGTFQTLAIFDKPDPLDGPFFEETIYVTPSREPSLVQDAVTTAVAAGAAALGLRHGPLHAECRVNDAGVYLLEIAARPIGGLCSKALRFVSPGGEASLEELLLHHALRQEVTAFTRERPASGVMMIPIPHRGVFKSVEGDSEARAVPGIVDLRITAKRDATLIPLPEGRSYLGFLFARATTPLAVEQALRAAHAKLHFRIDRQIAVL